MEEQTTGSIPETTANGKSTTKKRNVPRADIDLGALGSKVAEMWQANTWLALKWLTVEQFTVDTQAYNNLLTARTEQGSGRPVLTGSLKKLDAQIDDSIIYVKDYLADKYGKESAPDHYAAFGIVRNGRKFIMPKDRDLRKEALVQMLKGIGEEGFTDRTYGKAFWNDISNQFNDYLSQATQTDGGVSEKTGNKNELKKLLKKGLNAIVLSIKANYPDTWRTELRNWSFQKEKY